MGELCMGCKLVLKQNRILELEREIIMDSCSFKTELDRLRARNAKLERLREAAQAFMKDGKSYDEFEQRHVDLDAALAACDSEKAE